MAINTPSIGELNCLSRILRKATHQTVADALLKGFMWACWPEWYERNKWEFYKSKGQCEHDNSDLGHVYTERE